MLPGPTSGRNLLLTLKKKSFKRSWKANCPSSNNWKKTSPPTFVAYMKLSRYSVVIIKILRSLQRTQFQELITCHTKKRSRLISKDIDIDEHINNISSCHLSFFEELILCRGLKFSLPQHCSSRDIQVSFEKAFWRLDPPIKDPKKKELASATLCSIALNYTSQERPYSS